MTFLGVAPSRAAWTLGDARAMRLTGLPVAVEVDRRTDDHPQEDPPHEHRHPHRPPHPSPRAPLHPERHRRLHHPPRRPRRKKDGAEQAPDYIDVVTFAARAEAICWRPATTSSAQVTWPRRE